MPGPVVLEGYELVEVGAGVDHLLVANVYAGAGAFQVVQAFLDVQVVQGLLGAGDGIGVVGRNGTGLLDGAGGVAIQLIERGANDGSGRLGGRFGGIFLIEFVPAEHGGLLLGADGRHSAACMYVQ